MPVNYLNLYLVAVFGGLAAAIGGIMICYGGISETSYVVYQGIDLTTYYLDKNKHDLYLNGLVYSITFGIAFLLLLAVIIVPTPEQIQKRTSISPFPGSSNQGSKESIEGSTPSEEATSTMGEIVPEEEESLEIELEPDIESFEELEEEEEEEEEPALSNLAEDDDSDVVYGTGRITDKAHRSFILTSFGLKTGSGS